MYGTRFRTVVGFHRAEYVHHGPEQLHSCPQRAIGHAGMRMEAHFCRFSNKQIALHHNSAVFLNSSCSLQADDSLAMTYFSYFYCCQQDLGAPFMRMMVHHDASV
jgi:hypothetical protein